MEAAAAAQKAENELQRKHEKEMADSCKMQ